MEKDFADLKFEELHSEGVKYARALKKCETYLIKIIGIINDKRIFLKYNCPNIYAYTEKYFDFKFRKTATFLELYKSGERVPEFKNAIESGEIGYSKLDIIKGAIEKLSYERGEIKKTESAVSKNNQIETLIELAKKTSNRKLEIIARDIAPSSSLNKPSLPPKYIGNGTIECVVRFSKEDYLLFEKAKNLLMEEEKRSLSMEETITILSRRLIENKLKKGNKKAQIIVEIIDKKVTSFSEKFGELEVDKKRFASACSTTALINKRKAIPQEVKDYVFRRDRGRCVCCGKNNKLSFHHLQHRFEGGGHDPSKIVLLCRACHSLYHLNEIEILGNETEGFIINYSPSRLDTITNHFYRTKRRAYLESKSLKAPFDKGQNLLLL